MAWISKICFVDKSRGIRRLDIGLLWVQTKFQHDYESLWCTAGLSSVYHLWQRPPGLIHIGDEIIAVVDSENSHQVLFNDLLYATRPINQIPRMISCRAFCSQSSVAQDVQGYLKHHWLSWRYMVFAFVNKLSLTNLVSLYNVIGWDKMRILGSKWHDLRRYNVGTAAVYLIIVLSESVSGAHVR